MVLRWVKIRLTAPAFREARSLTTAVFLCAAIRMFVVDQRAIFSQSMQPALEFGDRILVDKVSVVLGKLPGRPPGLGLRRGDMVVFTPPEASRPLYAELLHLASGTTTTAPVGPGEGRISSLKHAWQRRRNRVRSPLNSSLDFTKRVVGLAGDRVGVRRGVLYVNDHPSQPLPRISTSGDSVRASYSLDTTVVPKDHIMVFGDNRDASFDSHVWGPLPVRNVIGRCILTYWPLSRAAWFGRGLT